MAFAGSEIAAGFSMPGRRWYVKKVENMMRLFKDNYRWEHPIRSFGIRISKKMS